MADRELSLILRLQDEVSKQLAPIAKEFNDFKPQFKEMAVIGTASFTAVAGAIALSTRKAIQNESAVNRLTQLLKVSRGASDEQINTLLKQAEALEKVGVASGQSVLTTQSQLATFDLQAETIGKLTPAILDYVIAEKGASASTDDFKQLTNGLAQALQGNFASLTKNGFVLDDATKEMISSGTEAERSEALVKVLNSTYKDFNITARNTAEGSLVALKNNFGQLQQTIGELFLPVVTQLSNDLLPVIQSVTDWVKQNPELAKTLAILTLALTGTVAVLGLLGLAIPPIIAGIGFLLSPIGLVVIAITALVAIIVLVVNHWDFLREKILDVWNTISNFLLSVLERIKGALKTSINFIVGLFATFLDWLWPSWQENFQQMFDFLDTIWKKVKEVTTTVWNSIKDFFSSIWESIKGIFKSAVDWIMNIINPLFGAIDTIKSFGSSVGTSIGSVISGITQRGSQITGVKDAVITPSGKVIQTDPADYLIATKTPGALGGSGGIIVNVYGDVSGNDLIEKVKDGIMKQLRSQVRFSV